MRNVMKRPSRICLILLIGCLCGLSSIAGLLAPHRSNATATGCVELLSDGSFEARSQDWRQFSAQGYELLSDFNPRTGRWSAYLAGVNSADDRISQQVTLPPAPAVITLRAWWYLATAETGGLFDTMTIALLRPDGAPLALLLTVDNTATVGVWDEVTLDLAPYAGQTMLLQFAARTDANNISDFYVDDVSLLACPADISPTATPTPTNIATATSTRAGSATPTASRTATPTVMCQPSSSPSATWTSTPTQDGRTATPTATARAVRGRQYIPYILGFGGLP
jgi:hypothetical protein